MPWYNCDILDDLDHIDILVVDGPPLPIHPEVRYPALPFFKERLRGDFAVLLDDADRPGELAVLERWSAEFPDSQFHRLPLEKGAAVIVPKQCHLWCSIVLRWMCVVPTHSTLRLCDSNKARMPNVRQINDHPYLYDAGLPMAVLKVRDEITRLPHCLVHHRAMGVSLFAIVDDGSRDGTLEYLLDQPDVVLFQASGEFGSSWISWISTLLGLFGVGRWVLIVDADEALVLPTSGPDALQVFLDHVEKEGADAVIANMVDMYSDRPISETVADSDQLLTEICPYFDPGPYLDWANPSPRPPVLYAGVRERIFWPNWRRNQVGWRRTVGSCRHKLGRIPLLAHWRDPTHPSNVGPPCIFACPLVRWTQDKVFVSRHVIEGVRVSAHLLPLLHFKFLADFYEKVADAVANRQYFRQSSEYRLYQNVLNKHRNLSLFDSASIRYKGTGSLISAGVMVVPSVTRDIRSGCRGPVPLTRPDARGGPLVEA